MPVDDPQIKKAVSDLQSGQLNNQHFSEDLKAIYTRDQGHQDKLNADLTALNQQMKDLHLISDLQLVGEDASGNVLYERPSDKNVRVVGINNADVETGSEQDMLTKHPLLTAGDGGGSSDDGAEEIWGKHDRKYKPTPGKDGEYTHKVERFQGKDKPGDTMYRIASDSLYKQHEDDHDDNYRPTAKEVNEEIKRIAAYNKEEGTVGDYPDYQIKVGDSIKIPPKDWKAPTDDSGNGSDTPKPPHGTDNPNANQTKDGDDGSKVFYDQLGRVKEVDYKDGTKRVVEYEGNSDTVSKLTNKTNGKYFVHNGDHYDEYDAQGKSLNYSTKAKISVDDTGRFIWKDPNSKSGIIWNTDDSSIGTNADGETNRVDYPPNNDQMVSRRFDYKDGQIVGMTDTDGSYYKWDGSKYTHQTSKTDATAKGTDTLDKIEVDPNTGDVTETTGGQAKVYHRDGTSS